MKELKSLTVGDLHGKKERILRFIVTINIT
jgi:hypothetical protein